MKKMIFLLCFAISLAGCHHHHEEGHNHESEHEHSHEHEGHHHEGAVLQLVAYNEHYEIYIEATPFSVGEESELLTHLTCLKDFSPATADKITARLTIGDNSMQATASTAEKTGIYHLHITPKKAGKGTLTYFVANAEHTDTLIIDNVEVFSDEHDALHEADEHKISSPTAITFTKEKSWQVDFATALPEVRPFGQVIRAVAQVQSAQGDEMTVVAKSSGILTFATHDLLEGKAVSQGNALFSIASDGMFEGNLTLQREQAKNEYEKAKQNYERAKSLIESKIVSEKEFLEYKTLFENAKLTYENLNKNVKGNGSSVTAPMSGYVKQILVKNGDYVTVGQPVIILSQNKDLVLKAEVPQRYATNLSALTDANVESPNSHVVYSLSELHGQILSYGKSVSENSHLLPITLKINNVGDFIPGSFVTTWFITSTNRQALVIPKSALTEEQGNYYVFVQLTPELFEKQLVKIGAHDGKNVEILSGITPGQRIVVRGAILVKLAKSSGALDPHAGHVH